MPMGRSWQKSKGLTSIEAYAALEAGYNIGLLTGAPSGRVLVVDVDGDHPGNLPATFTVASGGGGQHFYYYVPEGVELVKANKCNHVAPDVDIRYTGGQTVYPPSVHKGTGAEYTIETDVPLAPVPQWILDSLINNVPWHAEVGATPVAPTIQLPVATPGNGYVASALLGAAYDLSNAPEGCRNAMLNTKAYALAGIEGITEADIIEALLPAALAVGLTEQETRKTLASAIPAGKASPRPAQQIAPRAAVPTPRTKTAMPENQVEGPFPRALADKYLDTVHSGGSCRYYRGGWYLHKNGAFRCIESDQLLRGILSEQMQHWAYITDKAEERTIYSALKNGLLNDVVGQMVQARTVIQSVRDTPMWVAGSHSSPAGEYASFKNGLLHLPTRELLPHTPDFFCTSSVPVAFDANAPSPAHWIGFLETLWPGDEGIDCARLLSEWMGYCISSSMQHHKMLWLIGPPRSGKGTIAQIMQALASPEDAAAPTLTSLSDPKGATCLIDTKIAIIGDARLGKRHDMAAITERLLSLSGGDLQTIPRKYLPDWTGKTTAKITLLSNELPNLSDASGALAGRLLILHMTQSFQGREDLGLLSKLRCELPGILNWALEGYDRLIAAGRFTVPAASAEIMAGFRAISSPVSVYVDERCLVGAGRSCGRERLYADYCDWSEQEGYKTPLTKPKFGQELKSVVSQIGSSQHTISGSRERVYTGIGMKSGPAGTAWSGK